MDSKKIIISFRLTELESTKFHDKSQRYGQPSEIMREFVRAFIEDRLIVKPPVNPKESLYHVER
jgi:hypothetical protein